MFELKPISPDSVEAALQRATHYRLLNQPWLAESICRDVLAAVQDHHEAVVTLLLCLTDQLSSERSGSVSEALDLVQRLPDPYERSYFAGLVCERKAWAHLAGGAMSAGHIAYDWLRRAMEHYDEALPVRPTDNDDAVLRWNTCVRLINSRPDVRPLHDERTVHLLE
jgi:hypothetical protein